MTSDDYVGRCKGVVISVAESLPSEEVGLGHASNRPWCASGRPCVLGLVDRASERGTRAGVGVAHRRTGRRTRTDRVSADVRSSSITPDGTRWAWCVRTVAKSEFSFHAYRRAKEDIEIEDGIDVISADEIEATLDALGDRYQDFSHLRFRVGEMFLDGFEDVVDAEINRLGDFLPSQARR